MADPKFYRDGLDELADIVAQARKRLRELESATGTQTAGVVTRVGGAEARIASVSDDVVVLGVNVSDASAAASEALEVGQAAGAAVEGVTQTANDAKAAADTALESADAAVTAANGKNKTTRSANPASATVPGTSAGDLWFQIDSSAATIGLWIWDGSQWVSNSIDGVVIANLDVGTQTVGMLSGQRIVADSITATQLQAGAVTAETLAADAIDGKTITGATVRSAASGQRVELLENRLDIYATDGGYVGRLNGARNASGGYSVGIQTPQGYVNIGSNPNGGYVGNTALSTPSLHVNEKIWTRDVRSINGNNMSMVVVPVNNDGHRDQLFPSPTWGERVFRIDMSWVEMFDDGVWKPVEGFMPVMRAGSQANQTIPNGTTTTVAFGSSTEYGGFTKRVNGTGHEWVVPYRGAYSIGVAVDWASSAGGLREIGVYVNGSNVGRIAIPVSTAAASLSLPVALPDIVVASGGVIQFRAIQSRTDGGTSASLIMAPRSAVIRYLGPAF